MRDWTKPRDLIQGFQPGQREMRWGLTIQALNRCISMSRSLEYPAGQLAPAVVEHCPWFNARQMEGLLV